MTNLINRIHRKVFNTRILRKTQLAITVDSDAASRDIHIEYLDVGVIIMSRDTHREVLRLDYNGITGASFQYDKSQPYRMFGIRIAFDDSLPFGEVLVAGDVV
jgi:hypothetical protein